MSFFKKPQYSTVTPPKKKDIPKNLYTRCPVSGEILYNKELEKNLWVVPKSGYHFAIDAPARIEALVDEDSFVEHDAELAPLDVLGFVDSAPYPQRLLKYQAATGRKDAVISGTATLTGVPISLAVMDFRFIGASMGAVVGEKITRAIERGVAERRPVIVISASGGARMQEGIFSLMQMAKTSAALARLRQARVPFVSVLTNPTTGGVTASFASLGDIILAEPGALICFAGPRVIKETIRQDLPKGFQTAEFLLQRGLVDQIVSRLEMRARLSSLLHALFVGRPPAAAAAQT